MHPGNRAVHCSLYRGRTRVHHEPDRIALSLALGALENTVHQGLASTKHDQLCQEVLQQLTALIERFTSNGHHTPVRLRLRGYDGYDFADNLKFISRPRRVRPCDVLSPANDGIFKRYAITQKLHGNGGSLPATRGQSQEDRILRSLLIHVKGLRVKLLREGFDLIGVETKFPANVEFSHREIVQI